MPPANVYVEIRCPDRTNMFMDEVLKRELDKLDARGLRRSLRTVSSPQGREVTVSGRTLLNFSSNDYLGLAADPRLIMAAREALARYGFGAGASRLVCGSFEEHALLEKELAAFKKTEGALLFNSGYAANVGILSALCGRNDIIFSDKLNHASIVDGIILSRAEFVRYPHRDMSALEASLKKAAPGKYPRRVIVTDTVFSMDGDVAPLKEIVALAEHYNAWVVVDEAHAFGVFGKTGAGLVEELGMGDRVHVQMGTLSKAAGAFGAYCAGSKELMDTLVQSARSFMFTTALPPAVAAAGRAGLAVLRDEPGRRERLFRNTERLRRGFVRLGLNTLESVSPIIPVVAGDAEKAVAWSRRLWDKGIFVPAIRPPTVPANTARLRVTVTAAHTEEDLDRCIQAFLNSVSPS